MLGGCIGPWQPPDAPAITSRALGVEGLIRFESSGGPLDVPGELAGELTLEMTVREALRTDPQIQAALARVRAAEADAEQARLLPNPILSVTVRPRIGPESAIITPAISEDLVGVLERPGRANAAEHRLRAAAADALLAAVNSLADVQERYADVQAGEARLVVLHERRKLLDRLLNLARVRLAAGEGSRLDLTTVEAQPAGPEGRDRSATDRPERIANYAGPACGPTKRPHGLAR